MRDWIFILIAVFAGALIGVAFTAHIYEQDKKLVHGADMTNLPMDRNNTCIHVHYWQPRQLGEHRFCLSKDEPHD